jgi:plastocyanin
VKANSLLLATALLTPVGSVSAAVAPSHEHVPVTIKSYAYAPNAFVIHVGDTVVWTNEDSAPHTVTSASGPTTLDSPNLSKGQSWSFAASLPGTYRYYCAVHPDMRASFTVLASAPASPSATPSASASPVPAAARSPRPASRTRTAAPPVSPASSPTPLAAGDPRPAAPSKTLDPTLLLVAITVGAVAMALLALGRRTRPTTS